MDGGPTSQAPTPCAACHHWGSCCFCPRHHQETHLYRSYSSARSPSSSARYSMRVRTGAGRLSTYPDDWPTILFRDRCAGRGMGRTRGGWSGGVRRQGQTIKLQQAGPPSRNADWLSGRSGGGWCSTSGWQTKAAEGDRRQVAGGGQWQWQPRSSPGGAGITCSASTSWLLPLAINCLSTSAHATQSSGSAAAPPWDSMRCTRPPCVSLWGKRK